MDLTMRIEALMLPSSQRQTVGDLVSSRAQDESLADAAQLVVQRNMFFPPNTAPTLGTLRDQQISRDETFTLDVQGRDPDIGSRLNYSFLGEVPDGAQLDTQTGKLRWRQCH